MLGITPPIRILHMTPKNCFLREATHNAPLFGSFTNFKCFILSLHITLSFLGVGGPQLEKSWLRNMCTLPYVHLNNNRVTSYHCILSIHFKYQTTFQTSRWETTTSQVELSSDGIFCCLNKLHFQYVTCVQKKYVSVCSLFNRQENSARCSQTSTYVHSCVRQTNS